MTGWCRRGITALLTACIASSLLLHGALPSLADSAGWSAPDDLALGQALTRSDHLPHAVADRAGNVHVIWADSQNKDRPAPPPGASDFDSIFYTWWNGENWSTPVDIVYEPDGNVLACDIAVAADGTIILVWDGPYVERISVARVGRAERAGDWRTVHTGPPWMGSIAIHPVTGAWYYVAAPNRTFITVQVSADMGTTWSGQQPVWAVDNAAEGAVSYTRVVVDQAGVIHVAWQLNRSAFNWGLSSVWYARGTESSGRMQFDVREVARRLDQNDSTKQFISIAAGSNQDVHLVWSAGVGSKQGRFHQWSSDGGATWSQPQAILPGLSGQTGFSGLAVDSSGILHLLTAAYGPDGKTQARYAWWKDGQWSAYTSFSDEGEHANLVIVRGNEIHAVWGAYDGRVLHSTMVTDAPVQETVRFPSAASTRLPAPSPTALVTGRLDSQPSDLSAGERGVAPLPQPGLPMLAGVLTAACVVCLVCLVIVSRRSL